MTTDPLVSIITPVYNAESFLEKTIQSVLGQTYKTWEHILVVDFKSSDDSLEIANRYSLNEPRIRIVHDETNIGVAANRNRGILESKGTYIAFLDADDLWSPTKLSVQTDFMKGREIDFSFHSYAVIDENDASVGRHRLIQKPSINYRDLLKDNQIGCLTVMLSRKCLGQHRFYQGPHEDFVLWLDLLKEGATAYGVQEPLAQYRIVAGSRSDNKLKAALSRWQILRERERLNLIKSFYYFTCYFYFALLKRT